MKKNIKVVVLGEGAWGTALATLFARNGFTVSLWCYHPEIAEEINVMHTNNRYLPDFQLPGSVIATHDGAKALHGADFVCEAIPVQYMRSVIEQLRTHIKPHQKWIITSKGIEQKTLLFPAALVTDVVGYEPAYAVVVGPSFAKDLMRQEKTGLLVAADDSMVRTEVMNLFENEYVQCVESEDTHGAQLCAAFKNVVALLVGISDGKGHGDNARALLVTECVQTLAQLLEASGGSLDTVLGFAGIGDLFLTASSTQSRNYMVGKALGAGESLQSIIERTGFTPEGINTLRSMKAYAQKNGVLIDTIIESSLVTELCS